MNEPALETKPFSLEKRVTSIAHASRGLLLFLKSAHSAWVQIVVFATAILLGVHFAITIPEWLFIIFSGGMVLMAEAFNTAIEIHMDLTSPESHPRARDTKDVAAGAVLIAALTALAIGVVIYLPYFLI